MIDFILTLFRAAVFLALALAVPVTIANLVAGSEAAVLTAGVTLVLLFLDSFRTHSIFIREFRPTIVSLYGREIYRIEDASSHIFVTQGPWFGARQIWLTRGTLSLLRPEDLIRLVRRLEKEGGGFRLAFESYLTSWVLRLSRQLPKNVLRLVFRAEMGRYSLTGLQVIRSLPVIGILSILGWLYGAKNRQPAWDTDMRIALKPLLDESHICEPDLNPAFSNHALIDPWPHALTHFGRSCLR